jgi:hypothetical protein
LRGAQLWFHGIVLLSTFLMQRVGIKDEKKSGIHNFKKQQSVNKVHRGLPMSQIDDQKNHKLEMTTQCCSDSDIHEEGYQDKKFFTAGVDDEGRVLIAVRTLVGDNFAPKMDIVLLS